MNCVEQAGALMQARGGALHLVCAESGPVWRVLSLLELQRRWPVHHQLSRAMPSATSQTD